MFIGNEPHKRGHIDWRTMNQQARDLLARLDIDIDVTQLLGFYSVAIQQMVAIARALSISAKVVILDEPTSSLDAQEVEKLFTVMRNLRADGIGIIFITHFLDQVDAVSDRITVLRNGRLVGVYDAGELSRIELIAKMIGKNLANLATLSQLKERESDEIQAVTTLEANALARAGSIAPFDMKMHPGEVLGLAGLLGSGRTETANVLFGIDKPDTGELIINGTPVTRHTPQKSIDLGVGLCPEDRKADGVIPDLTVRENIILALQSSRGWLRALNAREQNEIADRYITALDISTPTAEQLVRNLSGGNQQKVILARWLAIDPEILILDEPTRGIDVGTKAEIQKLIIELAGEGKAVLFISSELDEVVRCSHRVIVLRDGHHVAELEGDKVAVGPIMELIAGESQESE
jgi:simple sugar transport system ATP-binding protein